MAANPELTDLMFQSNERAIFLDKLEMLVNGQHFSHDSFRLPKSLTMFYVGMVSTIFRTMVTRRQHVTNGLITVEPDSIVFTSLHGGLGANKHMNIFVFHTMVDSEKHLHLALDTYEEIETTVKKWGYQNEHIQEALDRVDHIFWKLEHPANEPFRGKLKFESKIVKVEGLDASMKSSGFVMKSSKEVISHVEMSKFVLSIFNILKFQTSNVQNINSEYVIVPL